MMREARKLTIEFIPAEEEIMEDEESEGLVWVDWKEKSENLLSSSLGGIPAKLPVVGDGRTCKVYTSTSDEKRRHTHIINIITKNINKKMKI